MANKIDKKLQDILKTNPTEPIDNILIFIDGGKKFETTLTREDFADHASYRKASIAAFKEHTVKTYGPLVEQIKAAGLPWCNAVKNYHLQSLTKEQILEFEKLPFISSIVKDDPVDCLLREDD